MTFIVEFRLGWEWLVVLFWYIPSHGVTKVNFDGSFFETNVKEGVSIIMQKEDGSSLFALAKIGVAKSVEVAKCWI